MKDKILSTIRLITAAKMMNRQDPRHALMNEIVTETGYGYNDVLACCRELIREGKITGGKTMSDNWVMAVDKTGDNATS
jgi:Na+-transporting NADH:ubiquinone oxidoreductase subunit NqrD